MRRPIGPLAEPRLQFPASFRNHDSALAVARNKALYYPAPLFYLTLISPILEPSDFGAPRRRMAGRALLGRTGLVVSNRIAEVGRHRCGAGEPLLWIAGPCVLENAPAAIEIATELKRIANSQSIAFIFKGSFDKANRTSLQAPRGPGLAEGLAMLAEVQDVVDVPVTTDIHAPEQATPVGDVCDLIQIPAFLARQTDLLVAAAGTGKAVNVKKAQFMAPGDMRHVVDKLRSSGCKNVLLCERGTSFGYGRLVNDMRSIPQMQELGAPVIFDATHSVQEPGGLGDATGGNRAMVEPLARAAMAVGADGLFCETHPEPDRSPSDGPNMVPLAEMDGFMERVMRIRRAAADATEVQRG